MYKIGNRFKHINSESVSYEQIFILACIDGNLESMTVGLISLEEGNRWTSPVKLKREWNETFDKITESEFDLVSGGAANQFELIA